MKWLLNESNFTWKDRAKLCSFFLNPNKFWTMADEVAKFEEKMASYIGAKYAVFVANGSVANSLIAMYLRDHSGNKNTVVFPSTTWITSISPFVREGFDPHFIDISLDNLGINLDKLEDYLKENSDKVACVFITSLLGFSPDMDRIKDIGKKYNVKIMMDNCESTLTSHGGKNLSAHYTSTTSTYFGHILQSVEGGFVFTNDDYEYDYFIMARNHGMVRGLKRNKELYANPDVDARFDFRIMANNYRNTNINAFIGQLDFERVDEYIEKRKKLYDHFYDASSKNENVTVVKRKPEDVPFTLPVIFETKQKRKDIQEYCDKNGIETRPIVSGNLLRQTCFKKYGNPENYNTSELLHHNGLYCGLHSKVKIKDIDTLVSMF
jgi:CDP-6-deoxy-D-xylo-4-hexulose-3-dehydrase